MTLHDLRTAAQITMDALRSSVRSNLELCTESQRALFKRIYPCGVDLMEEDDLRSAIGLVGRTLRQNLTGDMYGTPGAPGDGENAGRGTEG